MASTVRFQFELLSEDDGSIRSSLRLQSEEDARALSALPAGGLTQLPHALLLETLRREAYTMAISLMSGGRDRESIEAHELDEAVRAHILKMLYLFSPQACAEALSSIRVS